MRKFRFWLVVLALLWAACRRSADNAEPIPFDAVVTERVLHRAVDYLIARRGADGGWHSTTHGILKGGAAYTPYVIDALQASGTPRTDTFDYVPSYHFLLTQLDTAGALGRSGPYVLEYPVYATAYFRKIWSERPLHFDTLFGPRMESYLLSQQFQADRGIPETHPAYGAWGFGETNLPPGEVGHIDLSHTRRVLEALRRVDLRPDHPAWARAARFLSRLQNADGGFCGSTYTLGANKADDRDRQCVSYATATADGLLALLSLPAPDSARVRAAAHWLLDHEDWTRVSGITPDRPGNWDLVLFYYHLAVRAQAYARLEALGLLPSGHAWRGPVAALLAERQAADGSFRNPLGAPNKEDDPILATALALRALTAVGTEGK